MPAAISGLIEVPVKDLESVIQYLLHDERCHFLECAADGDEGLREHIFMAVCPLAEALGYEIDDGAKDPSSTP